MSSEEGEHSGLLVLEYGSSVVPGGKMCARIMPFSSKKETPSWMLNDGVVTSSLKSWPFTIRLSLAWSFEKFQWEHHDPSDGVVQFAVHQWLQKRERDFFWVGTHAFVRRGEKRIYTKMVTTLKINSAFSNVVVKFCEIFTCPTCKQHEVTNGRLYFMAARCIMIDCN